MAPNFSEEQLGAIATPFLILDGATDDLVRHDQPIRLAELIPDAQLVIIPGTGHFAPFEKPEEFAQILATFLAGESVGSPAA